MTTRRQPPPDELVEWSEPPPGFRVEWVEDELARLEDGGKCRRPGCRRPAVWALLRSRGQWWRYCDWHTYGRRIEPTGVFHRRLKREVEA